MKSMNYESLQIRIEKKKLPEMQFFKVAFFVKPVA